MATADVIAMPTPEEPTRVEVTVSTGTGPSWARYSHPIDPRRAGIEGDGDGARPVPITFHEVFDRRPRLSKRERKELAIKQAALRVAAGLESRTLRALAREIGCKHTAIDNAVARIAARCGMARFHRDESKRAKLTAKLKAEGEKNAQLVLLGAKKLSTIHPGKESIARRARP